MADYIADMIEYSVHNSNGEELELMVVTFDTSKIPKLVKDSYRYLLFWIFELLGAMLSDRSF